jgi:hypothetical protein
MCGSTVHLFRLHQEFSVKGTVLAVCIRFDEITYEVEWWDGNSRNTAWFSEHLVTPAIQDSNTQTIGFHSLGPFAKSLLSKAPISRPAKTE